jgi:hypothetical protein
MRIQRILLVLAAFAFGSLLYAQSRGQMPSTATPSTQSPTSGTTNAQMQGQNPAQTGEMGKSQAPAPAGMTEKEVMKEIKSAPAEAVIKDVKERGVNFDTTPDIEKKLRKAGATDEVVEAVRRAGPKVRAQMTKVVMGPGQAGMDFPKEQVREFEAIKAELDPDKAIALVDDFARKYPDSQLLSHVYAYGANGYQQKGDADKAVEYTEKGLKVKPDNLMCLIMSLGMLPQPQYLNSHAADRDKILQEAQSEASRALQLIPQQIPKQPNEADADYQKRLAQVASPVHASLGMVHLDLASEALAGLDKDELAKAEQEFRTAVTTDRPDPTDYYRLGEVYKLEGKLDDAMGAFTKASEIGQGTMIKAYADQQIEEVKRRKARGSAAPRP